MDSNGSSSKSSNFGSSSSFSPSSSSAGARLVGLRDSSGLGSNLLGGGGGGGGTLLSFNDDTVVFDLIRESVKKKLRDLMRAPLPSTSSPSSSAEFDGRL